MYRITPRLKAMLYRERFLENISHLEAVSSLSTSLLRLVADLSASTRRTLKRSMMVLGLCSPPLTSLNFSR